MFKEVVGKMELHVSHNIDYRNAVKRQYESKDLGSEPLFASLSQARNQ